MVIYCHHVRVQVSPHSSYSALLYMNDDFEGGEFIFTEMDAKTVTVRKPTRARLFSIFYLSLATF